MSLLTAAALAVFCCHEAAAATQPQRVFPFSISSLHERPAGAEILIAAMVPREDDPALLAFELALRRAQRRLALPTLGLVYVATQCGAARATKQLFDMLHFVPSAFVLFASGCPGLTAQLAKVSFFWNISLVSYSDTSPELADELQYRNLVRLVPSDAAFNLPRIRLLQLYNWTKTCSLYQDSSSLPRGDGTQQAAANAHLDDLLEAEGFNMRMVASERVMSFESATRALLKLKARQFRVISALTNQSLLPALFCAAFNSQMHGSRHVWIVSGFRQSLSVWQRDSLNCAAARCNCSYSQLLAAANNTFIIDFIAAAGDLAKEEFGQELRQLDSGQPYLAYAFDSVTAVAEAAAKVLATAAPAGRSAAQRLRNLHLTTALLRTSFSGLTGMVQFSGVSRQGLLVLQQLTVTPTADSVRLRLLSDFDTATGVFLNESRLLSSTLWPDGRPPRDRTEVTHGTEALQPWIFVLFSVLSALGVVLSLALMAVNIKYRQHRYIKMSSPQMNNLIIVGCVISYASVVLLGFDLRSFDGEAANLLHVCTARAWVLSIGFTLSFGAMFGKTWRVHCIFTNISMSKKIIKDYQLMLIVVLLLLLDLGILTTWVISDPMSRERQLLRIERLSNDRELRIFTTICVSRRLTVWIAALFVYKGLLLVVGCFFAWETRNVSIPALNDSKYIGMCVYNVLVMCLAGAAVSFALKDNQTAAFVITSLLILACTSITLALVFFPKLLELRRDPRGEEKRARATLHKLPKRSADSRLQQQQQQQQCNGGRLASVLEENAELSMKLQSKLAEIRQLQQRLRQSGCDSDSSRSSRDMNNDDSTDEGRRSPDCVWVLRHSGRQQQLAADEERFEQEIAEVQSRLLSAMPSRRLAASSSAATGHARKKSHNGCQQTSPGAA